MTNNLHILTANKIPSAILASDASCGLLLLRDAVYLLLEPLPKNLKIYVLEEDLRVRGIPLANISTTIELIDYQRFVDLSLEYKTNVSW